MSSRQKETYIKKCLLILIVAIIVSIPAIASSMTFSRVENESTRAEGNVGPFDIWSSIGLTGPGDGSIYFNGDGARSIISASSMKVVSWWQFWRFGSTNSSWEAYYWSAIYKLNGDLDQSAQIDLQYTYTNDHFNAAFDGRSTSIMRAGLASEIISASMYEDMDKQFLFNFVDDDFEHFKYNKTHYFAGLTNYDTTITGSIDLGTMIDGDYLLLQGYHGATAQTQAYGPGVTIATLISTFEFDLDIFELQPNPVPVPSTLLLLSSGILCFAGLLRRKKGF